MPNASTKPSAAKKVTIYSTPQCHFCHMTKDFLTDHNIPYEDIDVKSDVQQREHLFEIMGGITGVPVITIEDPAGKIPMEKIVGFDPDRLAAALDFDAAPEKMAA
jgi:glutaredoxin